MKLASLDFPEPLVSAVRDGNLVIFAGAGVCMDAPAILPSFKRLAELIAAGTAKAQQDNEPEARFLGRLYLAHIGYVVKDSRKSAPDRIAAAHVVDPV